MSDIERLAALLHEWEVGCKYTSRHTRYCEADDPQHMAHAKRLTAAGVRVGDDELDEDAVLAASAEAGRDAVIDSTNRLIVAFRRWHVAKHGYAPTEDDFREMLEAASVSGVRVGDDGLRTALEDYLRAIDLEAKRRDDMTRVQFRAADLHEAEVAWKAAEMLVRDTLAALRAALAA